MSRRGWWSRRSQVERVDLYTRQSLQVLLWVGTASVLLAGANGESADSVAYVVAAVGALVVTLAASPVLRDVASLYPEMTPLPWRTMAPYLVLAAVYVGIGLGLSDAARGAAVMVAFCTLGISLGGLRDRRAVAVLLVVLSLLPAVGARQPWYIPGGLAFALFLLFTVRASLWLYAVVAELDRVRGAQAALAVAEERLRFSRDLHDVLGRRLSAIAVKSELAATLADRSDPGASAQMLEVRGVAHEALREARELARGYRETDLDQELEGARSLLRSAGIDVVLDVDRLPPEWHVPAAWVVREAATNVLRHSDADHVSIRYLAPELTIYNDGASDGSEGSGGSGLAGLRERLAPLGATLSTELDGDRFVLTAALPARGPKGRP